MVAMRTGGKCLLVCLFLNWMAVSTAQDYCRLNSQHTMCRFQGPACPLIFKGLSSQDKEAVLNKHNELRRITAKGRTPGQPGASNMKKMVWNDELEIIAQRWAEQCNFGHDDVRGKLDKTQVGQNAYIGFSSQSSSRGDLVSSLTTATQNWFDEVSDPGFHSSGIDNFRFDFGTGHYTQVVWADSEELGCGMVHFKDGRWFKTMVICNYAPAGNFQGNTVYEIGQACSGCPSGYMCEDGLCDVSQTGTNDDDDEDDDEDDNDEDDDDEDDDNDEGDDDDDDDFYEYTELSSDDKEDDGHEYYYYDWGIDWEYGW